jgi:hypothetical protein
VLSASLLGGSALDLLASFQDAGAASEADVGWREVLQALVVAAVIVVLDEAGDGAARPSRYRMTLRGMVGEGKRTVNFVSGS